MVAGSKSERILIVDDDIESLQLISLMLQRHGYQVMTADSGRIGLAKATEELPDLIILDMVMPDISGEEVRQLLRKDSRTSDIPILVFTAKARIDDNLLDIRIGDDYLTKPTHPAELAARVRAIFRLRSQ